MKMNWYKMAKPNNWEDTRRELIEELEREPSPQEIQNRMLKSDFDDKNKVRGFKNENNQNS